MLLASKVTIPEPPPLFAPRADVMERLTAAKVETLTTIIAGPGYGKTMHAAWLARAAAGSVAWLQVDEWDGDFTRFLTYLAEAIFPSPHRTGPSLRWTSPELAMAEIAAAARDRGSLTLVFDDLHAAPGTVVADFVMQLARSAPPELHLFVTARPSLVLPLGRLRVTRGVCEIRQDDLCLNDDEAAALLLGAAGHPLTSVQLKRAKELAGGWGAGLVLLGAAMGRKPDWSADAGALPQELTSYLQEETWSAFSPAERNLLEAACLVRHMTASLAAGLLGPGDWAAALERLHHGYGVLSSTLAGEYSLHPMWDGFLRNELAAHGGAAELQARYRQAADVLVAQEKPFHAVQLYLHARSYAQAARLIAELSPVLLDSNYLLTLAEVLADLSMSVLRDYPWLALCVAHVNSARGRLDEARFYAGEASSGFGRDNDRTGQALVATLQCTLAILSGDTAAAHRFRDDGMAALAPGMDLLRARLLEQSCLVHRAEHRADLDGQERFLREALLLYQHAPSPQLEHEARVTDRLGVVITEKGQLDQAIRLLERSVDLFGRLGIPPWEAGSNLGATLSTACRFDEALAIFGPMAHRSERPMRRLVAALNLLDIYITLDRPTPAHEAARMALELAGQLKTPHFAARVRVELARLYRLQGEYGLAVTEAQAAVELAVKGADRGFERDARRALAEASLWSRSGSEGVPDYHGLEPGTPEWARTVALAGLYSLRNRTRNAREQGLELLRQGLCGLSQQSTFPSYVLRHWDLALTLAVVGLAAGVLPSACKEILTLLGSSPEAMGRRVIRLPDPEAHYLREAAVALEEHEVPQLAGLVEPTQRQRVQQAAAPPLRVHLLGGLSLRLNGQRLTAKELNWRKAMQLLLTLLVVPEGVTREVLIERLWPDADHRSGHNQLRVSLHHLRHLLEPNLAAGAPSAFLRSDAGKLSWIAANTRVDVWDVQLGLHMADRALKRGDSAAAALAIEQAARFYRGPMATEGCQWLEAPSRSLHRRMLKAIAWLVDYHQQDRPDRAIDYLTLHLELEPGDEAAVQKLMRLLALTNRRMEIPQFYKRCRDFLASDGIQLSRRTAAVFEETTRELVH